MTRSRRETWIRVTVLALAAVALLAARRALVLAFFEDGPVRERSAAVSGEVLGGAPVDRVRVVLIDGLSLEVARGLPHLDHLCSRGLDLEIDVGFPTVSLPVQHVLWTGATQRESGIMYRIQPLPAPPPHGLPARVDGSVAVAESHVEIAGSFGFSRVDPALERVAEPESEVRWRDVELTATAREALASDAKLAFLHLLRVDELGHRLGRDSDAYREAARWADEVLWQLFASTTSDAPDRARWIVLSDHGHRARGGHGGAEEEIRIVRGCVFGDMRGVETLGPGHRVTMVDVHRLVARSLGFVADPAAVGGDPVREPVAESAAGPVRWSVAVAVVLVALGLAARLRIRRELWTWGWPAAAWLVTVLVHGPISESNPIVYPPWGLQMVWTSLPVVIGVAWFTVRRRLSWSAAVSTLVVPALACATAACVLCGAAERAAGLTTAPPLIPYASAHASWFLHQASLAAGVAAIVGVGWAVASPTGRRRATSGQERATS